MAHRKKRSKDPNINIVLREIALIETAVPGLVIDAQQSFGVANTWPDALSRLEAPSASVIPTELSSVRRFVAAPRCGQFWIANCRE